RLQRAHDRSAHLRLQRARHLAAGDFDPRQLVVVPDAEHAESEIADRLFGALDRAQLRVGHLGVVRDARREAGRRRFVPGWEPRAARQLADLVLGEVHFVEGAPDAELARRLAAGPVVAAIVGVVAVDDDGAALGGDARQVRVELVL